MSIENFSTPTPAPEKPEGIFSYERYEQTGSSITLWRADGEHIQFEYIDGKIRETNSGVNNPDTLERWRNAVRGVFGLEGADEEMAA